VYIKHTGSGGDGGNSGRSGSGGLLAGEDLVQEEDSSVDTEGGSNNLRARGERVRTRA